MKSQSLQIIRVYHKSNLIECNQKTKSLVLRHVTKKLNLQTVIYLKGIRESTYSSIIKKTISILRLNLFWITSVSSGPNYIFCWWSELSLIKNRFNNIQGLRDTTQQNGRCQVTNSDIWRACQANQFLQYVMLWKKVHKGHNRVMTVKQN